MGTAPPTHLRIEYYYHKDSLNSPDGVESHQNVCGLLQRLRDTSRIREFKIQEDHEAFPTDADRQRLFETLRGFSQQHHVGLGRSFGSRKRSFWYLPPQFILVLEGDTLREVLPCGIGNEVKPLEYLERLDSGQPWTTHTAAGMEGKKHAALIAQILTNADSLESGLVFRAKNVQVSRDFGELGYVDLVFEDRMGQSLLVEVKVGPDELDKAIGQILRHRQLFAHQNRIPEASVRVGIACPYIPPQYHSICEKCGISCFEIPMIELGAS